MSHPFTSGLICLAVLLAVWVWAHRQPRPYDWQRERLFDEHRATSDLGYSAGTLTRRSGVNGHISRKVVRPALGNPERHVVEEDASLQPAPDQPLPTKEPGLLFADPARTINAFEVRNGR